MVLLGVRQSQVTVDQQMQFRISSNKRYFFHPGGGEEGWNSRLNVMRPFDDLFDVASLGQVQAVREGTSVRALPVRCGLGTRQSTQWDGDCFHTGAEHSASTAGPVAHHIAGKRKTRCYIPSRGPRAKFPELTHQRKSISESPLAKVP